MSKNLEKICLWIIRIGSYLILFTPLLLIRQTLFPFIFGKIVVFRIIVEITAAAYLLLIIYPAYSGGVNRPQYRPRWNGLTIAVTIFIFVLIFTSLVGLDIQRSFWSSQERMTGILTMIHFWAWFLILVSVIKEKKEWRRLVILTLVASFLVALYALGQKLGLKFLIHAGELRLSGTIGNPDFTATYLMVHLFLAAFLILREKKVITKILLGLLILFEGLIVYFTATRGAFLAIALSILVFLIFSVFYFPQRRLKIVSLVLLVVIIGAGIFLRFSVNQPYFKKIPYPVQRFVSTSLTKDSGVVDRFKAWQVGFEAWQERPIFGWGWENYNLAYNKHFTADYYTLDPAGSWYDRAHNALLDVLVMGGLLGLISYLAIFAFIFYYLWRAKKKQILGRFEWLILSLMFFAYFIQNNFVFDTPATLVVFYFCLGLCYFVTQHNPNLQTYPNATNKTLRNYENLRKYENVVKNYSTIRAPVRRSFSEGGNKGNSFKVREAAQKGGGNKFPLPLIIFLIIIFLPWAIYKFNLEPWQVSKTAVIAITTSEVDAKAGLYWYKKALAKPLFVNSEIRMQLIKTLFEQAAGDKIKDQKVLNESVEFTMSELEKNVKEHPFDARYRLHLGQFYNLIAGPETPEQKKYLSLGEQALKKALELAPQRLDIYYELARNKMLAGDFSQAIDYAKQAVNLNDRVAQAHWSLALAYFGAQEYEKGIQEVEQAVKLGYYYYDRPDVTLYLADVYAKLEKWDKAIYQTRVIIGQDPNNIEALVKQAIYYAKSGDKTTAIAVAKKILEIKPDLGPQVEALIRQIESY